jgi:hypothetical protein
MADTWKVLYQGQLGNSVATLATVGGGKTWIVSRVKAVNTDSVARTMGLYIGGTTASHAVTPTAISIPAGGGWEDDSPGWTLEAAQTIAGGASAATVVTVTVFGDEVS